MDRRALQHRLGPAVRVGGRQIRLPLAKGVDWQETLLRVLQTMAA
jgi:hypothetical protein